MYIFAETYTEILISSEILLRQALQNLVNFNLFPVPIRFPMQIQHGERLKGLNKGLPEPEAIP